ncbi:MAG: serine/threonine protein kinase [Actinobacteria bacterium]|nr:MAG: serine/threonine protein kinase [Actinomycetota bacterium]
MLSPGMALGGRYRLDERIASGGMGDVWRGTDEVLGRTVAVKVMLPALLDEPGFAERFRGEARTMATINHPGVVDIYDYGSDQHIAFLVMEYIEGDPLSSTLSKVGRLTPARTMALIAQAADALQAAHDKGVVHRDVKPGNLLVRPNGTLVLTDFGIARSQLVGQLTATGAVLGTASYISPEQATGGVATPASDIYSLGVVAYQCLAGRRPFEGTNPLDIAMKHVREPLPPLPADIPPAVRSVVERALAKDPKARWPSAAALARAARQATTAGVPQQRAAAQVRASSPVRPRKTTASASVTTASASVPPAPPAPPRSEAGSDGAHPPVARTRVSVGPGYNRAAASITPPQNATPYGYARPRTAPQRGSDNRQLLIVLAVVLGVLVLVCSGSITYRWKQRSDTSSLGYPGQTVMTVKKIGVEDAGSCGAAYCPVGARSASRQHDDPMNEG